MAVSGKAVMKPEQRSFWSYRQDKELDHFPAGALRWWLLALVVLFWSIEQFERLKIGPVLVYVFKEFNVGLGEWGVVGSIGALISAVGAYLLSNAAERYGRRPVIVYPLLAYMLISLGTALAPNFLMVGGLYLLGSFAVSGMSPAVSAAIRDLSPQMGRGLAYSFLGIAYTIGALLSTGMAAATLPVWPGWRPQFWLATVVAGITLAIAIVFYRDLSIKVRGQIVKNRMQNMEMTAAQAGFTSVEAGLKDGARIYRDWRIWVLCTAMLFWGIAYAGVGVYVPTFLAQYHGVTPQAASSLTSVFWIIFTVSVFLSGWLSDRMRVRKPITVFGGITTGLAFIVLAAWPKGASLLSLAVVWAVLGWFSGFIYPAFAALLSENAEEVSPFGVARAFGIMGVMSVGSGVILSMGVPIVVKAYGWPAWIALTGVSCLLISVATAFGRGPWRAAAASATTLAQ